MYSLEMTKTQVRDEMARRLPEFFDGYVLIGRVAGGGNFVVDHHIPDHATKAGIVITLANVLEALSKQNPECPAA